jgi:tripartite-type tricarboxylate transporter receptor subunit TctC
MKLPRRQFLHLAAAAAALPVASCLAHAQTYPVRPVRIIAGFPAGSTTDIVARLIGHWLADRLGQPFVIENRRAPDGYTLLLVSPASAINATLYENLSFNFIRDSAPVAGITSSPGLMVRASVGSGKDGCRVHRLWQGQSGES